jgi:hypothetical protein
MLGHPTSAQNIALNLIFEFLGESRINRTYEEYMQIAAGLPANECLHAYVNQRLREIEVSGNPPYEICHFRAGDRKAWYKPFPTSISLETVRTALLVSGMRESRPRRRLRH